MVSNQRWVLDADDFLASPPLKLDLEKIACKGVVCRRRRRSRSDNDVTSKNGILRLLLAAFLDVFCETLPKSHREHVRHELSLTLVRLKVVPSLIFAEEFSSVRKSFAGVLSSVLYNCFTSDPKSDCRLSIECCGALVSRYRTDFEEIEQIGAGGFGTVWKVKSLVDRCYYAIKRIPVRSDASALAVKVLNEVRILAMLQHENIVRYHCGWTELHKINVAKKIRENHNDNPVIITELDESDANYADSCEPPSSGSMGTEAYSPALDNESSNTATSDNGFSATETTTPRSKFWARGEGDQDAFPEFSKDSINPSTTSLPAEEVEALDPVYKPVWRTEIYIQMELCHCNLEKHLNERNLRIKYLGLSDLSVDGAFNRDLAIQILSGLEYIHQNNVIHRDIKPSNIFLKRHGGRFRILLGDFGLACGHNVVNIASCSSDIRSDMICVAVNHSIAVGTKAYAAPEQLKSNLYGPSVDIYSVGIVLFEAYHVFHTDMEKLQAISDVRLGKTKKELLTRHRKFAQNWPSVAPTIFEMTATDATIRPTATQLLQRYIHMESKEVIQLKNIIRNQKLQLVAAEKRIYELLSAQKSIPVVPVE